MSQYSREAVAEGKDFVPKAPGNYLCQAKLFDGEKALLKFYEIPFQV